MVKLNIRYLILKKPIDKDYNIVSKGYVDNDIMKMDSGKHLLKHRLLKIKNSMDNFINMLDYCDEEKLNNEASLKLDDIMKMLLDWSWSIIP